MPVAVLPRPGATHRALSSQAAQRYGKYRLPARAGLCPAAADSPAWILLPASRMPPPRPRCGASIRKAKLEGQARRTAAITRRRLASPRRGAPPPPRASAAQGRPGRAHCPPCPVRPRKKAAIAGPRARKSAPKQPAETAGPAAGRHHRQPGGRQGRGDRRARPGRARQFRRSHDHRHGPRRPADRGDGDASA